MFSIAIATTTWTTTTTTTKRTLSLCRRACASRSARDTRDDGADVLCDVGIPLKWSNLCRDDARFDDDDDDDAIDDRRTLSPRRKRNWYHPKSAASIQTPKKLCVASGEQAFFVTRKKLRKKYNMEEKCAVRMLNS